MNRAQQRALELLLQHFAGLEAGGIAHVKMEPEEKKMLAALPKLIEPRRSLVEAYQESQTSRSNPPPPDPRPADLPVHREIAAKIIVPNGATKAEKLADIERQTADCAETRALGTLRSQLVFAVGNPDARVMLIGEAPGAEEEAKGEPFVGPAGALLMKILAAMGLSREGVYITNVLKYRPFTGDAQGSGNRPPSPAEMAVGLPFLRAEIEVVAPEIIVAIGGTAAAGLLGRDKISVAATRGRLQNFEGRPLVVTYHPSYLLRSESQGSAVSMREKRKVWEDMLLVMETLKMNVSDKQRGYFQ